MARSVVGLVDGETDLQRILALSPSLLIWPANGAGWQGTSGGTLAASGQPLGLGADLSQLGGKTLSEWLAAPTTPELATSPDLSWDASAGNDAAAIASVTSGVTYIFQYAGLSTTATSGVNLRIGLSAISPNVNILSSSPAASTVIFTAAATGTFQVFASSSALNVGAWSSVSVRELPGNHLRAGTWASPSDAARGTYGRVPVTGRRNQILYSEDVSNAYWNKLSGGASASATTFNFASTSGSGFENSAVFTATAGTVVTASVVAAGSGTIRIGVIDGSGAFGGTHTTIVLTATPTRYTVTRTLVDANALLRVSNVSGVAVNGATVTEMQLETGSTATAYQKVVTAFDVTEAGVAETYYVSFDGSSDYYSLLNAISITESMTVVRAFKRASAGIVSVGIGNSGSTNPADGIWFTDNGTYPALGSSQGSNLGNIATTGSFVQTVARNGSTETIRRNGASVGSRAAATAVGTMNSFGQRGGAYHSGEISFLAVFPTELTGANLALVEQIAASTNSAVLA